MISRLLEPPSLEGAPAQMSSPTVHVISVYSWEFHLLFVSDIRYSVCIVYASCNPVAIKNDLLQGKEESALESHLFPRVHTTNG